MDGMLDYLMQDCIGPTQFYIGEGGEREERGGKERDMKRRKGEQLREKERGTKIEIERREGKEREVHREKE